MTRKCSKTVRAPNFSASASVSPECRMHRTSSTRTASGAESSDCTCVHVTPVKPSRRYQSKATAIAQTQCTWEKNMTSTRHARLVAWAISVSAAVLFRNRHKASSRNDPTQNDRRTSTVQSQEVACLLHPIAKRRHHLRHTISIINLVIVHYAVRWLHEKRAKMLRKFL